MVRIIVVGAAGRMGRQIIADALQDRDIEVVGAIDAPGVPQTGQDIGILCGHANTGVVVQSSLADVIGQCEVVIDFSVPAVTLAHLETIRQHGKAYVIGTTGFDPNGLQALQSAAKDIPVLVSANMSVGVNLLASVLPTIVKAIDGRYDIELIEAHHRFKVDAPSGTALMLADIIDRALHQEGRAATVFGRHGLAPRARGEIGIHAVRAGGNPGEHRLIFANEGEQIELAHRAFSRQTYSLGAIHATKSLVKQSPGFYDMQDIVADLMREVS